MSHLHVEECQSIVASVLGVEVLDCDFMHVDVPGLAELGSSIWSTQAPTQSSHWGLSEDLTVDHCDVPGAQSEHSSGLSGPLHSLEQNLARVFEEVRRGQRLPAALGLDSDEVPLLVVWEEMGVGEVECPQPLLCSGDLVGVGPANLGVVCHNDLRAGTVNKLPQISPRSLLVVAIEDVNG